MITWVNRGTLHLIAAEDEPLLHALTTPQLRTRQRPPTRAGRRQPGALSRGIDAIVAALGSEGPMTRDRLRAVLDATGVPTAGQALVHILYRATLDGLIVRGPMIGSEHAFVLRADWLGERPTVDRDRALAELARRYLVGHGPADDRDLAKWAQLPLRDARAGLRRSRPSWTSDRTGWWTCVATRGPGPLPSPRLLGPFDPLLLGWRSRELVLGDAQGVVTINGIFKAIALIGGRAAGTWSMPGGQVELSLWDQPSRTAAAALRRDAAAVQAYLSTASADAA